MPELPEVETIRRGLAPLVEGRTITELEIHDPRWCEPLATSEVVDAVVARRVQALARRGKYLIWELEDDVNLVTHLRMTGNYLYDAPADQPYRRVTFTLADGHEVGFFDPRRFGTGALAFSGHGLDALGVEPLDPPLSGAVMRAAARGRRAPVKAFLLDQRQIAGVGNIYADEALFRARIHPLREAGKLTRAQWDALADGIVGALRAGLAAGGATIDDFRHPDGAAGYFQTEFLVHLRKGEPCVRCGNEIVKFVAAGRGTYACERCQPKPRSARRTLVP